MTESFLVSIECAKCNEASFANYIDMQQDIVAYFSTIANIHFQRNGFNTGFNHCYLVTFGDTNSIIITEHPNKDVFIRIETTIDGNTAALCKLVSDAIKPSNIRVSRFVRTTNFYWDINHEVE